MLGVRRFLDSGGVYKLAFGPKAFIVISDPIVVRHLLKAGPSAMGRQTETLKQLFVQLKPRRKWVTLNSIQLLKYFHPCTCHYQLIWSESVADLPGSVSDPCTWQGGIAISWPGAFDNILFLCWLCDSCLSAGQVRSQSSQVCASNP